MFWNSCGRRCLLNQSLFPLIDGVAVVKDPVDEMSVVLLSCIQVEI